MNWKAALKVYALPIAAGSFAIGVACGCLALVGYYDTRIHYCDSRTNPCTWATIPQWYGRPPVGAKFIRVESGTGLWRTLASITGAIAFPVATVAFMVAEYNQQRIDKSVKQGEALEEQRTQVLIAEELQKVTVSAEMRLKDFRRRVYEELNLMYFEDHPEEIIEAQVEPKAMEELPAASGEPKQTDDPTEQSGHGLGETGQGEPESKPQEKHSVTKYERIVELLIQSDIRPIINAGVLKVIGGQGSGKTTLINGGLLRYRVFVKRHRLILINTHKSYEMYRGLEPYLVPGSSFYGVGLNDAERAASLRAGLEFVLGFVETRYNEYQNLPKDKYYHYRVTVLLEECGEWLAMLDDQPFIQQFWQKMFVACRKSKVSPLITVQDDTMTMFGNPKGLSELIKKSGAVTLNMFAEPSEESEDGWRPLWEGELRTPGKEETWVPVKVPNPREVFDEPDDFSDLIKYALPLELPQTETEASDSLPETSSEPSTSEPEALGKLPPLEPEAKPNSDVARLEAFSAKIDAALAADSPQPLFEGLDKQGKLLMLRLLLARRLGVEKTIFLAWGTKSGGRNHAKYQMASQMLNAMIQELDEIGYNLENNWGMDG